MRSRLLAAITLVLSAALPAFAQGTATRPNVVLIITDDVGYGDIGSYGAPDIRTPHIDSLARDGVRLTDFYAAPQCTPTRAALMSGRYQQRVRLERALGTATNAAGMPSPAMEQGLPVTGRSLPQLLKNNGYATALLGKWHLGYKPEFSPTAHGFDYFLGFKSGLIDYYQHTDQAGLLDFFENNNPLRIDGYTTDLFTDRSVKFIEENAQRPFFLELAYNAAHWPYQVPDKPSVARDNARHLMPHDENTSTRADYVAMLERADQGVGRILATLNKLGLTRNTLVIFTNDNGGEWLSRNAPLYHRKDTLWEGGIRVPTVMRWPGRLPAGRTSAQVGITMDLTATILAATATPIPDNARFEGINLLPILEGRSPVVERTLFWRIAVPTRQQRAVRQGNWKLLVDGDDVLLYDLSKDIGERNDLAAQRSDIARRLRPLITEWEKDVDGEAKGTQ
ncbi:MAG: twin-arginine translocation pathway signal protein [Acidimicrobiia bacterium]|nr:twin-arginine translocation pathway signal protein [Acidimicrobiia bacterium]